MHSSHWILSKFQLKLDLLIKALTDALRDMKFSRFSRCKLSCKDDCVNLLQKVSKISKYKLWLDQKLKDQSVEPYSEDKFIEKSFLVTAIECQSFESFECQSGLYIIQYKKA